MKSVLQIRMASLPAAWGRGRWSEQGASPERSLLLALSPVSPSRAQLELHVPTGLTKLQVAEGTEVVLPAWYTIQGEAFSVQPWEVPVVMWFLEQEGKDLNQVRGKASKLYPTVDVGKIWGRGRSGGGMEAEEGVLGKSMCPQFQWFVCLFVFILNMPPKTSISLNFPQKSGTQTL